MEQTPSNTTLPTIILTAAIAAVLTGGIMYGVNSMNKRLSEPDAATVGELVRLKSEVSALKDELAKKPPTPIPMPSPLPPSEVSPSPTPATSPGRLIPNGELTTYQSDEIGISFDYSVRLGTLKELRYKDVPTAELQFLVFFNAQNQQGDINMSGVGEYRNLPALTCEEAKAVSDRTPDKCETLTINGKTVILMTFTPDNRGSDAKIALFQTKKGIWEMNAQGLDSYEMFVSMLKSVKNLP